MAASSSRLRPCDTCRLRKTRCVKEAGQDRCVLCTFHRQPCTFLRGPVPRQRRTARESAGNLQQLPQSHGAELDQGLGDSRTSPRSNRLDGQSQSPSSVRHEDPSSDLLSTIITIGSPGSEVPRPAILNDTLGLDLGTHAEFVGPSDYREPVLLDLHRPGNRLFLEQNSTATPFARRLDDRAVFLVHPDEASASEAQRITDLDAIEATVRPLGSTLVDLYFRIVHPSFPILHKDVFISKHRISHHHFAPSLLAAVYLIALDWQLYDSVLAGRESESIPDAAALEELAERTIAQDMRRPKLSTLEAGLLLFQRSRRIVESGSNKNTTSSRTFTAQLVAMAQDLGIHLDCSSWSIPAWEIGLRRRLAWALYMQDRWGAFVHGRPYLIHDDEWDVRGCSDSDFPELTSSEDPNAEGTITAQLGWQLFLYHIELTHNLGGIMSTFYTASATRSGGTLDQMGAMAAAEMARPLLLRLRAWHADLPDSLHLQSTQLRTLCSNGSLHLAHAATELCIHRALVRILTPDTPESLHSAVRSTARARLQAAIELLASLRPEHTAAFWGGAAAHQAAQIGSLAGLLWATAESSEEMTWCAARVDDLRWALRVRGAAAPFAREALRLLEREIGGLGVVRPGNDSIG